jgi:Galactosyltransferase
MGLQWGVQFCPQAQMLIKVDDDTAINLPRVLQEAPPLLVNGSMIGAQFFSPEPLRNETKWAVSLQEWPRSHYPDYLSGYTNITFCFVSNVKNSIFLAE